MLQHTLYTLDSNPPFNFVVQMRGVAIAGLRGIMHYQKAFGKAHQRAGSPNAK